MPLPTFLIIGAAKAGTTSLYHYLGQHPDIYMSPIKEPKFFAHEKEVLDFRGPGDLDALRDVVTDWEAYKTLFRGVKAEKAIGEASAEYLYNSQAPERIRHYIPNAKLIVILRHPVERAYSSFLFMRQHWREPCETFEEGLVEEEQRIRDHWEFIWHYKKVGKYGEQLQRYFYLFPREQIHIILFEEFQSNPRAVVQSCFRFLEVDACFEPDVLAKHMVTICPSECFIPRHKALYDLCHRPRIVRMFVPTRLRRIAMEYFNRDRVIPPLRRRTKESLLTYYTNDIRRLERMIGRDLSRWRTVGNSMVVREK